MRVFYVLVFFSIASFCQNNMVIEVSYSYVLDFSTASEYIINSRLITDSRNSLYEIDHTGSFNLNGSSLSEGKEESFSNNISISIPAEENEFVYKDFMVNSITYEEVIQFKHFYIAEHIPKIKWTLTKEQKQILGYQCKRATAEFRGRKYEAFYTEDLALNNGPWLFQGLPGLILEVNVINPTDLKFSMQAFGIRKLNNPDFKIDNPYANKKTVTWEEFLELYKKKYDEVLRNNMTPDGPGYYIVKKSIMTYIED